MPPVMRRFLTTVGDPATASFKPALTFDEARMVEQGAGSYFDAAGRPLKPAMKALVSEFAAEMRKSTMSAAGQSGVANTFQGALDLHARGMQNLDKEETAKNVMMELIKMLGKGAAYGAGAGGGYEVVKGLVGGGKK